MARRATTTLRAAGLCATLALTSWLASCPAPTGHHRGIVDSGDDSNPGSCSGTETPVQGGACSVSGEMCSLTEPCPGSPLIMRTDMCSCQFGFWSCIVGDCTAPPIDVPPAECPDGGVLAPATCMPRELGLYCSGYVDCNATHRLESTLCWCNGDSWQCDQVCPPLEGGAGDAADTSSDAAMLSCPTDGRCMPGLLCQLSSNGCTQSCHCGADGASLACDAPVCPDQ